MKSVKLVFITVTLMLICATVHGQLGNRLGNAAGRAAERAATRQTERRTEQAVDNAINSVLDGPSNNSSGNSQPQQAAPPSNSSTNTVPNSAPAAAPANANAPQQEPAKAAEMAYAKSDFVPGDEIIFDDPMDNEKLGEFPSQWDLISGTSEVVMAAGKKGFEFTSYNENLVPLMKNPRNYLGDEFTVEFDFLSVGAKSDHSLWFKIAFWQKDGKEYSPLMSFEKPGKLEDTRYWYHWSSPSDNSAGGDGNIRLDYDTWHHIAMSFNKRAWKVYINGERIINVPNVKEPPGWFDVSTWNPGRGSMLFTNFRVAKGAVPLYDRMMSDGKFITYGITFDVGKSTIKPESMGEINRITTLMKENPDLKFSVEGHTDSTGNAATNQTLSEARSQAVVDKLVENGVAADRLKAAGKGQTTPIADNATDEGKAKNRRVEFVKI